MILYIATVRYKSCAKSYTNILAFVVYFMYAYTNPIS